MSKYIILYIIYISFIFIYIHLFNFSSLIQEANRISKERAKYSNQVASSIKVRSTKDMLEDNKNICHKNYLKKVLIEERQNINDREKHISQSLLNSEKKLNQDELEFQICKEEDTDLHKQQELKIIEALFGIKNSNIKLKELIEQDKRLLHDMHYQIKRILSLQKYASFIHDVTNIGNNGLNLI